VFEFVFECGSRLAVVRLAWVESVENQGVESGWPVAQGLRRVDRYRPGT
jgi:hypothetical protein